MIGWDPSSKKRCKYETYEISQIKRDLIIEKQMSILCNTVNVFQTSLPFYATQIIDPFFNSRIKGRDLANRDILIQARKNSKGNFSNVFISHFAYLHLWISSPLQTKLVDGSNRKETRPQQPRIQFENFPCETFPCKMSLYLGLIPL